MEASLRERKKAATRLAISDVATRMFIERGFEEVTLADIARAADVSVKTIFNHFGSKEELFYDREQELLDAMVAVLRDRPPGTSPTAAIRPHLLDSPLPFAPVCTWSQLEDGYEDIRSFLQCEARSPALRARRVMDLDRWRGPMAEAAGSNSWAAMFVGVLALRADVFRTALFERRATRTVERRVRLEIGEALDALERAFPGL